MAAQRNRNTARLAHSYPSPSADTTPYDHSQILHRQRQGKHGAPLQGDTDVWLTNARDVAVLTSVECDMCHGYREDPDRHPYCGFCFREWDVRAWNKLIEEQKLWLMRRGSRAPLMLPCGHPSQYERWTDPWCPACDGQGYQTRWVSPEKLRKHTGG